MMPQVELFMAFSWTCKHCEHWNFVEAVPAELNSEERSEVEQDHGIELQSYEVDVVRKPTEVTCKVCKSVFATG
jgi:hypothetical protein